MAQIIEFPKRLLEEDAQKASSRFLTGTYLNLRDAISDSLLSQAGFGNTYVHTKVELWQWIANLEAKVQQYRTIFNSLEETEV